MISNWCHLKFYYALQLLPLKSTFWSGKNTLPRMHNCLMDRFSAYPLAVLIRSSGCRRVYGADLWLLLCRVSLILALYCHLIFTSLFITIVIRLLLSLFELLTSSTVPNWTGVMWERKKIRLMHQFHHVISLVWETEALLLDSFL